MYGHYRCGRLSCLFEKGLSATAEVAAARAGVPFLFKNSIKMNDFTPVIG